MKATLNYCSCPSRSGKGRAVPLSVPRHTPVVEPHLEYFIHSQVLRYTKNTRHAGAGQTRTTKGLGHCSTWHTRRGWERCACKRSNREGLGELFNAYSWLIWGSTKDADRLLSVFSTQRTRSTSYKLKYKKFFFFFFLIGSTREALVFPSLMMPKTLMNKDLSNLLYLNPLSAEELDKMSYRNSF